MKSFLKDLFFRTISSSLFTNESGIYTFFRRIVYMLLLNRLGRISVKHIHGFLWKCSFDVRGGGNSVYIEKGSLLFNCQTEIRGTNNTLQIGEKCGFGKVLFGLRDNHSLIQIGARTEVGHDTAFIAMEGYKVEVGEDSLFSYRVEIRNTDSHSIINEEGTRTNNAKDVNIGRHVWVGQDSLILKGTVIPDNSIIGAKSIVNKKFVNEGSLIVGSPANVIRTHQNWNKERI